MSNTIDNRVVSLEFDNAKFERNVATSMSTLDKLKEKLHFKGATDSLSEIEAAGDRVELGGISGAVDTIKNKFSALETVAVGALLNIGSRAVDAGEKLVKSLSLDQISAGFDKYAKKTTSVQTILNATKDQGENMESVTKQLERLNWFTDETSYSFTDMVENIGKFTNNGVKLNDAVEAMEGIATWAGISGANVQQASHAMYNLSQAMGVGYVSLIDWKSIENAQMATREFKQMAIEAAVAQGTLRDLGNGEYISRVAPKKTEEFTVDSFNSQLASGRWLTRDVLTEVLKKYSSVVGVIEDITDNVDIQTSALVRYALKYRDGTIDMAEASEHTGISAEELTKVLEKLSDEEYDLSLRAFKASQESRTFADVINYTKDAVSSGWMNTFEKFFGNYEEAVDLWSGLSETMYEVFVQSGDARNEMLQEWYEAGGRDDVIGGLWNIVNGLVNVLREVRKALAEVFPPLTAEKFKELTERFRDFTERFKMTEETAEKVRNTFKGVFSVFKILWTVLKAAGTALKPFAELFRSVAKSLFGATGGIGESISEFAEWLADSGVLQEKAQALADWLRGIPEELGKIFEKITGLKASEVLGKIRDAFTGFVEAVKSSFRALKGTDESGTKKVGKNVEKIRKAFDWIVSGGKKVWGALTTVVGKIKEFFGFVKTSVSESEGFQKATAKLHEWGEKFKNYDFSKLSDQNNALSTVTDRFSKVFGKIKDFFKTAWDFVRGGAKSAVTGLSEFFANLKERVQNFRYEDFIIWAKQFKRTVTIVLDILKDVGVVALVWELRNLTKNLSGIAGSFKGLLSESKTLVQTVTKKLRGGAVYSGFQGIANGIKMIAEGLALIALSVAGLAIVQDNLKDKNALVKAAIIIGSFTVGLAIIAGVLTVLAREYEKFNGLKDKFKGHRMAAGSLKRIGRTILAMSAGILIIAFAIAKVAKAMSSLKNPDDIGTAFWVIAGLLLELGLIAAGLVLLQRTLDQGGVGSSMLKTAIMILGMTIAVKIIAKAVADLAKIKDTDAMWNAAFVLMAVTGVVALIFGLMALATSGTKGLAALGIAAAAVGIVLAGLAMIEIAKAVQMLIDPLTQLSKMPEEALKQGLIALGLLLLELAGTALIIGMFPTASVSALAIIEVAYAISMIMKPLQTLFALALLDWETLKRTIVALGVILGELALTADAVALFPTSIPGATGMLLIVRALAAVCKPLKTIYKLAKYDWKLLKKSIGSMGIILGELTTATWLTSLASPSALPNAEAMRTLVQVIADIPDPLLRLGEIPWHVLSDSIKAMRKVLGSLRSVLFGSGLQDPFSMMASADSIATLAGSLGKLPGAVKGFSKIDLADVEEAATKISTVLGTLRDALSYDDPETKEHEHGGLFTWIDDLLAPSRADAIATLTDTIPKFAESIKTLVGLNGEEVSAVVTSIGEAFVKFGDALTTGVSVGAGSGPIGMFGAISWTSKSKTAAEAIAELVESVDTLTMVLPPFMDVVKEYGQENVNAALTTLGEGFKKFGEALDATPILFNSSRANGIGALVENITTLTNVLPGFLDLMANAGTADVSTPLFNKSTMYGGAFTSETLTFAGTATTKINKVAEALGILGEAFRTFGQAINDTGLVGALNGEGIGLAMQSIATSLDPLISAIIRYKNEIPWTAKEVKEVFSTLKTAIIDLGAALKTFGWAGSKVTSTFSTPDPLNGGFLTPIVETETVSAAAVQGFYFVVDALEKLTKAFSDAIPSFSDANITAFTSGLDRVRTAITEFKDAATTLKDFEVDFGPIKELATKTADEYADAFEDSLDANTVNVNRTLTTVITKAYSAIRTEDNKNLFRLAGGYLMLGLKDGIVSKSNELYNTVRGIARGMRDAFADESGIESPSKVFRQFGVYIDQGLIEGLEGYSGKVSAATETMASDAVKAAYKPFDGFVDDWTETMTITPVLDLSDIQNDRMRLANSLSGFGVGASVSLAEQNALSMARRQNVPANGNDDIAKLTDLVRDLVENPPSVNNNEFNITNGNPDEVAEEVERRLTRDIERRNAVWHR